MSYYCNRYLDDAPGIRADCARHLEKHKCETCPHRDIQREVVDLRRQLRLRARKAGNKPSTPEQGGGK